MSQAWLYDFTRDHLSAPNTVTIQTENPSFLSPLLVLLLTRHSFVSPPGLLLQSHRKLLQPVEEAQRKCLCCWLCFWVAVAMKQWHKHTVTKAAAAAKQCPDGVQEMPPWFSPNFYAVLAWFHSSWSIIVLAAYTRCASSPWVATFHRSRAVI